MVGDWLVIEQQGLLDVKAIQALQTRPDMVKLLVQVCDKTEDILSTMSSTDLQGFHPSLLKWIMEVYRPAAAKQAETEIDGPLNVVKETLQKCQVVLQDKGKPLTAEVMAQFETEAAKVVETADRTVVAKVARTRSVLQVGSCKLPNAIDPHVPQHSSQMRVACHHQSGHSVCRGL